MDLLLAPVRAVDLDREALVALPAVRARRERARQERRGADEPRVRGRDRHRRLALPFAVAVTAGLDERGRGVRDVDVDGQRALLERARG